LSSVMVFVPVTVNVAGLSEAGIALSITFQLPDALVTVFLVCFPKLTDTFSPAAAVPHIGTGLSRCKTISLPNILGNTTSALLLKQAATDIIDKQNAPILPITINYWF
jgi:hypothetical protein